MRQLIANFAAGYVSTLLFHQGAVWLLGKLVGRDLPFWNLAPVPPLNMPAVLSLAFWGGVWAILILGVSFRLRNWQAILWCIFGGAVGPTVVAMLIVFPAKEIPVNIQSWMGGLIVNAAWGLGLIALGRKDIYLFKASRSN